MKVTMETLCICGHRADEHSEEWLECIHSDCPCGVFMAKEEYEDLMLAGEELDGGADEFVEVK